MNHVIKITLSVLFVLTFTLNQAAQEKREDLKIRTLVSQLSQNPWHGAEIVAESPTMWDFALTEPMRKILEIGSPAQDILLESVNDPVIKDQIIFLLGGVGDEKAIDPIIRAMIPESKINKIPNARKINRSANLALTNITVADVIWHHGGGIVIEKCSANSRECWEKWWKKINGLLAYKLLLKAADILIIPTMEFTQINNRTVCCLLLQKFSTGGKLFIL